MLYVLYESPKRKKKLFVINCLFQKISCLHIGCKKTKRLQLVKKYFFVAKIQSFSESSYPSQPKYVPSQSKYDECDCVGYLNKVVFS